MPAMIEASLDAGCHVWHEKPGFADLDDYRRLYCKAQAAGLNLSIAYVSRQRAIVQEARRIVAEGLLGDLFACQAWFIADHDRTHQWATLQGGWIFDKARSGGGYLTFPGLPLPRPDAVHHGRRLRVGQRSHRGGGRRAAAS